MDQVHYIRLHNLSSDHSEVLEKTVY